MFIKIKEEYRKEIQFLPEWYQQIKRSSGGEQVNIYQYSESEIHVGRGSVLRKILMTIEAKNQERVEAAFTV